MTDAVEISAITSIEEVRAQIQRAGGGNPTIYRDDGEDVAVLMPAAAFRAVQKLIKFAWTEFPISCWDDPVTAIVFNDGPSNQERSIGYPQPGRLPTSRPQSS